MVKTVCRTLVRQAFLIGGRGEISSARRGEKRAAEPGTGGACASAKRRGNGYSTGVYECGESCYNIQAFDRREIMQNQEEEGKKRWVLY
jgi:hypothetical protein